MIARPASLAVRVPGDKSISHRALICAALASGRSRIRDILPSADVRSTGGVLRALGARVPPQLTDDVRVDGRGLGGLAAAEGRWTVGTAAPRRGSCPEC